MSVIINFSQESSITAIPYLLGNENQALALDLLATLFQSLNESTLRLADKINNIMRDKNLTGSSLIERGTMKVELLIHGSPRPIQMNLRTIISDAWSTVDYAHLVGEILPVAKVELTTDEQALLRRVKMIRNSYHHNNERIDEHFSKAGAVFGNLSWQYKDGNNTSTIILYPNMSPTDCTSGNFEKNASDDAKVSGVSTVKLHFVEKENKKASVEDLEVNLDLVAEMMNNIIQRMEGPAQSIIDQVKHNQQENAGATIGQPRMPPVMIIMIRNNEDMQTK